MLRMGPVVEFSHHACRRLILYVEGPQVVFRRSIPSVEVSRSTWVREGADVILTGPTEYDFNLDGMVEDGTIVIRLTPR